MKKKVDLSVFLKEQEEAAQKPDVNHTEWDFIALFVVDLRDKDNYEIIDRTAITLRGGMDAESYYSECLDNTYPDNIIGTQITNDLDADVEPGVYRLVFGGNSHSSEYWTDCGYEYDAWEEYTLLSLYKFTKKEEKYITDWEGEPLVQLETDDEMPSLQ